MYIQSILLTVHDNDFYNTFINLLDSISRAITYDQDINYINEEVCNKLILDGIDFHYKAFQNQYRYGDSVQTVNYLKDKLEVWFNDEADNKVKEISDDVFGGNGEYYYLIVELCSITSL